jgi:hypothetical protein
MEDEMNKYSGFVPASHTQASIESRMAHIFDGGESHFTDAEAALVLPELASEFINVTVVRNCPSAGFTRIGCNNVNFQFYENGVRFIGEAL